MWSNRTFVVIPIIRKHVFLSRVCLEFVENSSLGAWQRHELDNKWRWCNNNNWKRLWYIEVPSEERVSAPPDAQRKE
jgi:hypothetical protein